MINQHMGDAERKLGTIQRGQRRALLRLLIDLDIVLRYGREQAARKKNILGMTRRFLSPWGFSSSCNQWEPLPSSVQKFIINIIILYTTML